MNNIRRKKLSEIYDKLDELKEFLEELKDEEQDYLDNIPENLQASERYEKAENAISNIEESICCIEEAMDKIEKQRSDYMKKYLWQKEGYAEGIGTIYTEEQLQDIYRKNNFKIINIKDFEKWVEDLICKKILTEIQ